MKARMFEIECPSCHETFFLMRDTYYVKGMDPRAEERLLNGSYFMHRCRKCDTIFTIYHPLLFRSPKKFNLIMSKKKQIETGASAPSAHGGRYRSAYTQTKAPRTQAQA